MIVIINVHYIAIHSSVCLYWRSDACHHFFELLKTLQSVCVVYDLHNKLRLGKGLPVLEPEVTLENARV